MIRSSVFVLAALGTAPVFGHVVADPAQAPAGSYTRIALRVGHGCNGSPTTGIEVAVPTGVAVARPMPKPGWTLAIEHDAAVTPADNRQAREPAPRVVRIAWTGRLDDAHYDEFVLLAKLPASPGTLRFPVVQTCEQGSRNWTAAPGAGEKRDAAGPAPTLQVLPGKSGHHGGGHP